MSKSNISVFGMGYVGCITSSCLTHLQHRVIGIDICQEKLDCITQGQTPVKEPLLHEYMTLGINNQLLSVSSDPTDTIAKTDITFICVDTPPSPDGSCDLSAIKKVMQDIGIALKQKYAKKVPDTKHIIIVRSTIPPGTMEDLIIPLLEKHSGLKINFDFFVCFHPEFLREGNAISDFFKPAKYIIGESEDPISATASNKLIDILNLDINDRNTNIIKTNFKIAELVKYTDNVWHALKVTFANEIGTIAEKFNIDARELMTIFCADRKLNISEHYLKPGLSYGGSCLPKDLEGLRSIIQKQNITLPLISSIEDSNNAHITRIYNFINKHVHGKIGWYGITFKDNTDDLRNSVHLEILSKLINNHDVKFTDYNIDLKNIMVSQDKLLKIKMPNYQDLHIDNFLELLNHSDTLIIGHAIPNRNYKAGIINYDRILNIIDLTEANPDLAESKHKYQHIFDPKFSN